MNFEKVFYFLIFQKRNGHDGRTWRLFVCVREVWYNVFIKLNSKYFFLVIITAFEVLALKLYSTTLFKVFNSENNGTLYTFTEELNGHFQKLF